MLSISNNSSRHLQPNQLKKAGNNIGFGRNVEVEIKTQGVDIETINRNYKPRTEAVISELKERIGQPGQRLDWIKKLPETQQTRIKEIYDKAKNVPRPGQIKDLVILGLGGSRYTTESMIDLVNPQDAKPASSPRVNVHFYSGADDDSFNRLAKKIDPAKTLVMVVSNSGTTRETTAAHKKLRKLIETTIGDKDKAKKHFIAMTSEDPAKSALRRDVNKGKYGESGVLHDNINGRFTVFDDPTLFTLAYLGMPRTDMKRMLTASIQAQNSFLKPDLKKNTAMQEAIFNDYNRTKGKNLHLMYMHGDALKGTTELETYRNNESVKLNYYTHAMRGPEFLHINAERDFSPGHNNASYSVVNIKPDPKDKTANVIINGSVKAYAAHGLPIAHVTLQDRSPETIGEFAERQQFVTLYSGMLSRRTNGNITPPKEVLPEMDQPNVKIYKAAVDAEADKKS